MKTTFFTSADPLILAEQKNISSKSDPIKIKNWCADVLRTINIRISEKQRTDQLSFSHPHFPPGDINLYQQLQEDIAEILPLESNRPTIMLYIRGKNRLNQDDLPDLGLLGGVGPLSDAHIVSELVQRQIQNSQTVDDMSIVLLSSPPPRKKEIRSFFWDNYKYLSHGYSYLNHVTQLAAVKCPYYAILSNSMHLHTEVLEKRLDKQTSRLIHLVKAIAEKTQQSQPEKVLILGTLEAAQANLYPAYFNKNRDTANSVAVLPVLSQQETLQQFIDKIKGGEANTVGHAFVEFLRDIVQSNAPSHIILSCTEIPLLLNIKSDDSSKTYLELLKEKIDQPIVIIDSEAEMVDLLYEQLKLTEQEKLLMKKKVRVC